MFGKSGVVKRGDDIVGVGGDGCELYEVSALMCLALIRGVAVGEENWGVDGELPTDAKIMKTNLVIVQINYVNNIII